MCHSYLLSTRSQVLTQPDPRRLRVLGPSPWRRVCPMMGLLQGPASSGPKQRLLPVNPLGDRSPPHLCPARCAGSGDRPLPYPGKYVRHFARVWGRSRPVPLLTLLCSRSFFSACHTGRRLFLHLAKMLLERSLNKRSM